tara:strand:+ start:801 stop:1391 length:591 start_codon:yes stop_codon:yes gene_type:complete
MPHKNKYNVDDFIGKIFEGWTVIGFSHRDKQRTQHWRVKCKCGYEDSILISNLFRKTSTGCKKCGSLRNRGIRNSQWKGGSFISQSFLLSIRQSAEARNIAFKLSVKDLEKQFLSQNGKCAYTNLALNFSKVQSGANQNRVDFQTASLDRIDSTKGYNKANIQFVHKTVNVMKWDFKEEYFLELIEKIYKHKFSES